MKYKVKEICSINSSNLNKKDNYSYINYLDTSNITEGKIATIQKLEINKDKIPSRAKRKVQKNDIIISTVRPNLKHYGIIKNPVENMIVSTGFAVLTPNTDIVNPEYLYWYLTQQQITDYLAGIAETSTTAYPSLTPDVIGNIEIELPIRNIQDKIAKTLTVLDSKTSINIEINKNLEEIAQTIFKHWFVDFEFPNENGEPYKSSGGKFVESELGMIPEGWKIETIGNISTVVSKGTTPTKKDMDNANDPSIINFIKVKDIDEEGNIQSDLEKIATSIHEGKLKRSILKEWDILFSIAGTIGRVSYITKELENSNTNQAIAFIRLKDVNSTFGYILQLLKTTHIQNEIKSKIVQGVQANVSLGTLKNIKFPFPNAHILEKYNSIFLALFNKKVSNDIQIKNLVSLRDILLSKLLSGEIRIPEAEEAVESCLQKNN